MESFFFNEVLFFFSIVNDRVNARLLNAITFLANILGRCSTRTVKMGYNLRANPTHHEFGSDWVEKKLQISVQIKIESNPLRTRLIQVKLVMC